MVLLEAQGRGAAPDRRLVQKKPPQTSWHLAGVGCGVLMTCRRFVFLHAGRKGGG